MAPSTLGLLEHVQFFYLLNDSGAKTGCFALGYKNEYIYYAYSLCGKKDMFCKKTGRRLALDRLSKADKFLVYWSAKKEKALHSGRAVFSYTTPAEAFMDIAERLECHRFQFFSPKSHRMHSNRYMLENCLNFITKQLSEKDTK